MESSEKELFSLAGICGVVTHLKSRMNEVEKCHYYFVV